MTDPVIDTGPVVEWGLPDRFRPEAARLYFTAFWPKLSRILGAGHQDGIAAIAAPRLRADRAIVAHDGATLLGVAGFKRNGHGLIDLSLGDLGRHYGWFGGLWRGLALSFLDREARPGELLMDGICVSAQARGQGIGTRLLDAIAQEARRSGATTIRLDVIDTNPRARDLYLYLRQGFQPVRTQSLGLMRHIFGFSAATEMHKPSGDTA